MYSDEYLDYMGDLFLKLNLFNKFSISFEWFVFIGKKYPRLISTLDKAQTEEKIAC